jgi:hypothetical protein
MDLMWSEKLSKTTAWNCIDQRKTEVFIHPERTDGVGAGVHLENEAIVNVQHGVR